eukprot:4530801-Lingulodinium_polyedra.AAC.1
MFVRSQALFASDEQAAKRDFLFQQQVVELQVVLQSTGAYDRAVVVESESRVAAMVEQSVQAT